MRSKRGRNPKTNFVTDHRRSSNGSQCFYSGRANAHSAAEPTAVATRTDATRKAIGRFARVMNARPFELPRSPGLSLDGFTYY